MTDNYSPWDRYRLLDTCYRLDLLQQRIEWGIFVEADCFQTVEAYAGIGDVINPLRLEEDAGALLLPGEMEPFLALRAAMDNLRCSGSVDLDGPLPLTISFMQSKGWLKVIIKCQLLLNVMLQNGIPGLVDHWAKVAADAEQTTDPNI